MKKVNLILVCLFACVQLVRSQVSSAITVAGGTGPGSAANQLSSPSDIFLSGSTLYVCDQGNHRIQKWLRGALSGITVAGGNGAGSAANQLSSPQGVYVDAAGNVFVADYGNGRVQKWAPGASSGTTVAGGSLGPLSSPADIFIVTDQNGFDIVVIVDILNHRILQWSRGSSSGVTHVGGNGQGSASNQLSSPTDVLIRAGVSYICDQGNHRIQRWPIGTSSATTIAGGNGEGSAPNQLSSPGGIFSDASNNIYIADTKNDRIQKWAPGAVSGITVAGGNGAGSAPDQLHSPSSIVVDGVGNVYVADRENHRVQKFSIIAPHLSAMAITVAGGNGQGSAANQFYLPTGFFVDAGSNIYVTDRGNHRIQKWVPGALSGITVAGGNGNGSGANQLKTPNDVFVDGAGNIYVADDDNDRIQKWAPGATSGVTVAGGNGQGSAANQLYYPNHLFVDPSGNVYVADGYNHRIQKWSPGAVAGITVAGGNGQGSAPNQLSFPDDIVVDAKGNIFIADYGNYRVQKWAPGASAGVTVAGGNGRGALASQISFAYSIFVDQAENIYVADPEYQRIQKWAPGATEGITVAGGSGSETSANQVGDLSDVFLDGSGNIYVSDIANHRIQKFGSGNGLGYKYFEGAFATLPDFNALAPVKSGRSANVEIGARTPGRNDNFAFTWEGSINIPAPGTYTFETISDDGSNLYFNSQYFKGAIPTVNNDGLHQGKSASGTVNVVSAGAYPITISFFENSGDESMQVYWSGPGIPRQRIPDAAFTLQSALDSIAPSAPLNLHVVSKGGNFITLDWNDASDNSGVIAYDVYVGGVYKYSTSDSQITADSLSPNSSFTFTVKARDLNGNSSGFSNAVTESTTNTLNGLAFKYYEGNWNALPDFTALTPIKTGNSLNVDIGARTPGRNDNFAFVWEGYITITTPGAYTFETVSDDGSRLYFNSLYNLSAIATVNNDGLHAPASATGTVNITSAGTYPISITFFEKDGGEQMQVYWTGPGIARQLIPNSAFVQTAPPPASGALTYKYYEGAWNSLPDFNSITPVKTGNSNNIDISVRTPGRNDNFAFVWEGYINITAPGSYTFETVSDDGSKLYFNSLYDPSATSTVNNDGLHAPSSATGTVNISTTGAYPISITFFEKDGGEQMQVYWTGPGIARQLIPNSAFVQAPPPPQNGLFYKYYEGTWNTLPDFNTLVPVKTGSGDNVDIGVRTPGRNDNFGFLWQGYIKIPTAGNYTFETLSDDGSKLYFNSPYNFSATATVNNDGLHAPASGTGTVTVPAAGIYPISITFFEKDGGETMQVYWTGPGIARQLIPNSAFLLTLPAALNAVALNGTNLSASSLEESAKANAVINRIYPNPFDRSFKIDFYNSSSRNDINVDIYDLNGKQVFRQHAATVPKGNTSLSVNPDLVIPGVYMVQLKINGIPSKIIKLVKMK